MTDGRFWYRVLRENGPEFLIVDPAKGGVRTHAFDHARLAAALSEASGEPLEGAKLPFQTIDLSDDNKTVAFSYAGKRWKCNLDDYHCAEDASVQPNSALSPDKRKAAFVRDYNLWIRDIASGAETQLTADGIKDFGYATDNAGWVTSDRPILLWSPDSRKIATFPQDQRGVGEMYLVSTAVGHPKLKAWKYPLPGDEVVTTIQRVVIDVDRRRVTRLKIEPASRINSRMRESENSDIGVSKEEERSNSSHVDRPGRRRGRGLSCGRGPRLRLPLSVHGLGLRSGALRWQVAVGQGNCYADRRCLRAGSWGAAPGWRVAGNLPEPINMRGNIPSEPVFAPRSRAASTTSEATRSERRQGGRHGKKLPHFRATRRKSSV